MSLRHCFLYCLFFYIHTVTSSEYVYPVASLGNGATILYIHQNSSISLELFEWNPKTNNSEQILWSVFNPAGLQLLPNNAGFSFIDNGRLRIKLFQRRSPKAIDFDEPLFNINALQWIDEQTCYCSAQQGDNFALFQLYDEGTMECLMAENGKDCMYPQKVDEQLFYIMRYTTQDDPKSLCYKIVSTLYHNNNACVAAGELVADFHNRPIVFLTMVSDAEGFVLEHEQTIDSDNPTVHFSYHQIIKEGDVWTANLLFSFNIPTTLLLPGEERLYESLLPLLPRIVKNSIYFVDCVQNKNYNLEPFYYNISTQRIKKVSVPAKKMGHYFVPFYVGNKFYCGGTYNHGQKTPLTSFLT